MGTSIHVAAGAAYAVPHAQHAVGVEGAVCGGVGVEVELPVVVAEHDGGQRAGDVGVGVDVDLPVEDAVCDCLPGRLHLEVEHLDADAHGVAADEDGGQRVEGMPG